MSADSFTSSPQGETSPAEQFLPEFARTRAVLQRMGLVAVLAALLGIAVQGVMLATLLLLGSELPAPAALAVEFARGVTWSVLVCCGVGIATLLVKARPLLSGFVAFCLAPIALAGAKAAQKLVADWLKLAESEAVLALGTVSILRAVEYGLLGWLLGRLVLANASRPWPFLGAGSAVAVPFGGAIAALTLYAAASAGTPLPLAKSAATVLNEFASPIGCAMAIYWGRFVARHLESTGAP